MASFPRRIIRLQGQEPPVFPPIYRMPAPAAIANPQNAVDEVMARMAERYGEALANVVLTGEGQAEVRGLLGAGGRMSVSRLFPFLYGGTVNGRFSSREPDMQRIPRSGSAMDRLRAMSASGSRIRFLSTPQEQVDLDWVHLPSRAREVRNYTVQSMNANNRIHEFLTQRGSDLADAMAVATVGRAVEQITFSMDTLRDAIIRMGEGLRTARISPADYNRLRLEEANRLPPDRPIPTTFGSIPIISDPNIPEGRAYIIDAARGLDFSDLERRVIAWDLAEEMPSTPPVPDAIVGDQIIDYKLAKPIEASPSADDVAIKQAVVEASRDKRPFYQRMNDAPRSFKKGKGTRR